MHRIHRIAAEVEETPDGSDNTNNMDEGREEAEGALRGRKRRPDLGLKPTRQVWESGLQNSSGCRWVWPPRALQSHDLHFQFFFYGMPAQEQSVNRIQSFGIEVTLTAFAANFRRHVFDNVQPTVQPVLLFDFLL